MAPIVPFTLLIIMPTNNQLQAIAKANREQAADGGVSKAKDEQITKLLVKWNRLHLVRSVLSATAFFTILADLKKIF